MSKKHSIIYRFFRPLAAVYLRIKFGYTYEKAKDLPDTYIVLSNHTTDYDPLMVASSFGRQMYFVASEHINRWGLASKLLRFAFQPILRKKGMSAASAILDVLRKVRGGDNVCMFAEGVRTWDGVTCPIVPTTGQLIKRAGCALVTYKIKGGYFLSPGWSNETRRGWAHGAPVAVYTREQLAEMSVDEINEIIRRDLHEDAYARQLADPKPYKCKANAANFENLLYICPWCGEMDTIRSHGDTIECEKCGGSATMDAYGMISGMLHRTVTALAAWQKEKTRLDAASGASYTAKNAVLWKVLDDVTMVSSGAMSLSASELVCGDFRVPTGNITDMAIHGRDAIVFSVGKDYYELLPEEESILKFKQLYDSLKEED